MEYDFDEFYYPVAPDHRPRSNLRAVGLFLLFPVKLVFWLVVVVVLACLPPIGWLLVPMAFLVGFVHLARSARRIMYGNAHVRGLD